MDENLPSSTVASGRIFMSYRRQETAYPAGWLFDRLSEHFGREQVFKDVDSLQPGDDFVSVINAAVGSCDVLLALIGHDWLSVTDDSGARRLDDPNDFVRLEIEAALSRRVRVIPILVDGARMPRPAELPETLRPLVRRHALELSPSRFAFDFSRLLLVLDRTLNVARDAPEVVVDVRRPAPGAAVDERTSDPPLEARDAAAAHVVAALPAPAAPDPTDPDPPASPRTGRPGRRAVAAAGVGLALAAGVVVTVLIINGREDGPNPPGDRTASAGDRVPLPAAAPVPLTSMIVPEQTSPGDYRLSLFAVAVSGEETGLSKTAGDARGPALSPDRRTIAYIRQRRDPRDPDQRTWSVRVMATDGSGDRRLFPPGDGGCLQSTHLSWNPRVPTQLAVACRRPNRSAAIYLVDTKNGVQNKPLVTAPLLDDPAFSPDGRTVTFWRSKASDVNAGVLWTVSVQDRRTTRLTDDASYADPSWDPSGTRLVATRSRGDESDIVILGPDGGFLSRLDDEGDYARPAWSPDGRHVAAVRGDGGDALYVFDADHPGSPEGPVVDGAGLGTPAWASGQVDG